jgi:hypothetical protein
MSPPFATLSTRLKRVLAALAWLGVLAACGGGQPAGPTIVLQPEDQSVLEAATATFKADTTSAPTWQWQYSTDGGATWADISGATATSYTTPPTRVADNDKRFRAVVTNSQGVQSSRSALLTVASGAIAYEGFNYPLGERLKGQNGGSGWAGAWDVADGNGTPLDISQSGIIASGLRYRDSAGNDLITSGGAWQTDASVLRGQALRVGSASFGAAGTSRWVSFLVRQAQPSNGTNIAAVALGTGYVSGDSVMAGGFSSDASYFVGCFLCAASNTANSGFTAGAVAMVLMRIDFTASGNDNLSLWINPPLNPANGDAGLGTPTLSISASNFAEVLNGLTLAWGDNRSFTFDELRIANSRAHATPFAPGSLQTSVGKEVFFTDFTSPLPSQIAPGTALIESTQGFSSLGFFSKPFSGSMLRSEIGNTVTLTLTALPAHEWLSLDFFFAAIDALAGSGAYPAGDFFRVSLDGVDIFRESFANAIGAIQTYEAPPSVQLARRVDLGFSGPGGDDTDSAYRLGNDRIFQRIPHSSSTAVVTMRIEGTGPQSLSAKSWGIDDLRVYVGP